MKKSYFLKIVPCIFILSTSCSNLPRKFTGKDPEPRRVPSKEEAKPVPVPLPTKEVTPANPNLTLCQMEKEYLQLLLAEARESFFPSPPIQLLKKAIDKIEKEKLYPIYNWYELDGGSRDLKKRLVDRIHFISTFGPCEEAAKQYQLIYAAALGPSVPKDQK